MCRFYIYLYLLVLGFEFLCYLSIVSRDTLYVFCYVWHDLYLRALISIRNPAVQLNITLTLLSL